MLVESIQNGALCCKVRAIISPPKLKRVGADLVSQITCRLPLPSDQREGGLRVSRLRCHRGSLRRVDHPRVTIFQLMLIKLLPPSE